MHALKSLRFSLLASAAFILPLAAHAQDAGEIYTLDDIIVSGSLTPVPATKTGATVDTVEADETGDTSEAVLDALTTLPGVSFSSNGGLGASSTLRIRGLDARYVGVRINGIDVSDPSNGQPQFDFGGLTGFGISSIEVLKGSQSALYGSEAVAGLIDIRTDGAVEPGYNTTVELSGGSYGTYAGGISSVLESEAGKLSFGLSHVKTDGFSSRASDTEDDGYEATTLTFGLEQDVSDRVTLGLSGLYITSDNEYDLSTSNSAGESSREQKGLRSFARIQGDVINHEFSASLFDTERSYPGGYTEDYSGKRREFAYLGSTDLSALSTLTFGVEYTEEEFNIDGLSEKDDNMAIKAEWLHSPMETLDLSVALRYDDHSDFGDHLSGRLAAAWEVAPDWTLRAVLGTGFRAPSLYERYSPYGKADLKEETSQSAEIGIERRFAGDDFVKGTLFYTEIKDRIDYDFATSSYNQVSGKTVSKGLELSGHYTLSERVALFGNYTYTDAETAGEEAQRVPRHDLVVGIDAVLTDQINGQLMVQHVADVTPSPYAPADHKVGDYTLVNAGLSYQLNDATELSLRIENLTDEDYETAGGYNTPGRSAYLGLKASF
ncbi:TonB-dependent siderophore receptor [Celeribacter sp. PS-C1]|uniref:TonB-dependent receptor plug domain-containing protein n=1 Tax=Celeribacter sp. PS-C1 TaxID=2820813 RepID=UPI001CA54F35|nr:TonB-dependent receptor [Celeribacter sp. PS-C1]MBW6418500.1 TonB-dependent receptor [Celeribacter sp. PS-C1]